MSRYRSRDRPPIGCSRFSGAAKTVAAVVTVPRRIAGLLMPGQLPPARWTWAGTRLRLPHALTGAPWTCPLTLEAIGPAPDGLDAADLFGTLPVALLLASPPA